MRAQREGHFFCFSRRAALVSEKETLFLYGLFPSLSVTYQRSFELGPGIMPTMPSLRTMFSGNTVHGDQGFRDLRGYGEHFEGAIKIAIATDYPHACRENSCHLNLRRIPIGTMTNSNNAPAPDAGVTYMAYVYPPGAAPLLDSAHLILSVGRAAAAERREADISLVMLGFDEDPRDVWEIPEVREHVRQLYHAVHAIDPGWWARAPLRADTRIWLALTLGLAWRPATGGVLVSAEGQAALGFVR